MSDNPPATSNSLEASDEKCTEQGDRAKSAQSSAAGNDPGSSQNDPSANITQDIQPMEGVQGGRSSQLSTAVYYVYHGDGVGYSQDSKEPSIDEAMPYENLQQWIKANPPTDVTPGRCIGQPGQSSTVAIYYIFYGIKPGSSQIDPSINTQDNQPMECEHSASGQPPRATFYYGSKPAFELDPSNHSLADAYEIINQWIKNNEAKKGAERAKAGRSAVYYISIEKEERAFENDDETQERIIRQRHWSS